MIIIIIIYKRSAYIVPNYRLLDLKIYPTVPSAVLFAHFISFIIQRRVRMREHITEYIM